MHIISALTIYPIEKIPHLFVGAYLMGRKSQDGAGHFCLTQRGKKGFVALRSARRILQKFPAPSWDLQSVKRLQSEYFRSLFC